MSDFVIDSGAVWVDDEVNDNVWVVLDEGDCDCVNDLVFDSVEVTEDVGASVNDAEWVMLRLLDTLRSEVDETLNVGSFEGDRVRERVGDSVKVRIIDVDTLSVCDRVSKGVRDLPVVLDSVRDSVIDNSPVCVGVTDSVGRSLNVTEGVFVADGLGVTVSVSLWVGSEDSVADAFNENVRLTERVCVASDESECDTFLDRLCDSNPVSDAVIDMDWSLLRDAVTVASIDVENDSDSVGDSVNVTDADRTSVRDCVDVRVRDCVLISVCVSV